MAIITMLLFLYFFVFYPIKTSTGTEKISSAFNVQFGKSLKLQNSIVPYLEQDYINDGVGYYIFNNKKFGFDSYGLKTTLKNKLVFEVSAKKVLNNMDSCLLLKNKIREKLEQKYKLKYKNINVQYDSIWSKWSQDNIIITASCERTGDGNDNNDAIYEIKYIDKTTKDKISKELLKQKKESLDPRVKSMNLQWI